MSLEIFANNLISKKNFSKGRDKSYNPAITALIVQGGGMRGIYSMGALSELQKSRFADCFDYVVGSSSGAINGAYFLAKQSDEAVDVYLKEISNRKFIDILNPAKIISKKIVDINFLVDSVLSGSKKRKLNVNNVISSKSDLHILLTDTRTASRKIFTKNELKLESISKRDKQKRFMNLLRGTSAIPLLFDETVRIEDRDYIDGGVLDPLPLMYAINELKCTDILVILTRPLSFRRKPVNFLIRFILKFLLKKAYSEELNDVVRSINKKWINLYNKTMETIEKNDFDQYGVRVFVVYPTNTEDLVNRTTVDAKKLEKCATMGEMDMRKMITELEGQIREREEKKIDTNHKQEAILL